MTTFSAVIAACLMFAAATTTAAPVTARMSAEECKVWTRELSFADALARHDAVAFAGHLEKGAAFSAESPQPLRGDAVIAKQWSRLVEGKSLLLSWYPTRVTIGGVADVASSSGPALYEDLRPDAKTHYSIGGFHSVWHRGRDDVWRILFDDGIEPKAADEAEVSVFRNGRQAHCPIG